MAGALTHAPLGRADRLLAGRALAAYGTVAPVHVVGSFDVPASLDEVTATKVVHLATAQLRR